MLFEALLTGGLVTAVAAITVHLIRALPKKRRIRANSHAFIRGYWAGLLITSLDVNETDEVLRGSNWNRRYRKYKDKIDSDDPRGIAQVLRDLFLLIRNENLSSGERIVVEATKTFFVKRLSTLRNMNQVEIETALTHKDDHLDRYMKHLPKIWELGGIVFSKKVREEVYEPAVQDLLKLYFSTRKYRGKWAHRWLAFAFSVRTVLLMMDCARVGLFAKVLRLLPAKIRQLWGL